MKLLKNKLKSDASASRDWWSILNSDTCISPNNLSSIENEGQIIMDNLEVPYTAYYDILYEFSSLTLTPAEIEIDLKSLPV